MSLSEALKERERRVALAKAKLEKDKRQGTDIAVPDVSKWIADFITIEDPQAANRGQPTTFKFDLWPEQSKALEVIKDNKQVIILKARQLGISWLIQAYALWLMMFHPEVKVIIISKDFPAAKEVIRRIQGMYTRLAIKPVGVSEPWNARELTFSNGANVKAVAARPGSGAGYTSTFIILDEFALIQYAEQVFSAIKPTMDDGGKIVILSTAENKTGEVFEDLYRKAELGENSFKPIFLPWWVRPSRTREWYEAAKMESPNPAAFAQQYPESSEDAFSIISKDQFVTEEDWEDCFDPSLEGDVTDFKAPNGCEGQIWISKRFNAQCKVVWAMDGSVKEDSTVVAGIMQHPDNPNKFCIAYMLSYYPTPENPVDFDDLTDRVEKMWKSCRSIYLVYDMYQLAPVGQRLAKKGVKAEVFQQQSKRWESDTLLRSLVATRNFNHAHYERLDEHVGNADGVMDKDKRSRIIKRKRLLKIDACVTIAMGVHKIVALINEKESQTKPYEGAVIVQRELGRSEDQYRIGLNSDPGSGLDFNSLPRQVGF